MHRPTATDLRFRVGRAAWAVVFLVVLTTGCATVSPPGGGSATPAAPPPASAAPDRDSIISEALEETLLAREQARLGLMDEAQAAWQRAIKLLSSLAVDDPRFAEQLRAIEAERDQALRDAELRAEAGEDEDEQVTEGAAAELLEEAEPPLDPALLEDVGPAAQQVAVDYPVVLNDRVYAWLEQWSGKLKKFFAGSIARSGMHLERFRQIFAEEGVPQDLVHLAHVESGFKTSAYSRAAAKGIFQFIAETGRRYGLVTNWWIDERSDPEKSCRAAAAYLRDLYAEFGDWYLALAAYNGGEGRVRDALARTGNKDFFAPENQRLFRRETRNYVPAILAATLIAKEPAKFGFGDVAPLPAVVYETVTVPTPTSLDVLAACAETDVETLRALNPALRRRSTPPAYGDFLLKTPVGAAAGFAERLAEIPPDQRLVQREHVVKRGETLASVARRYGVSTSALRAANQLGRKARLRAGMALVIPNGHERLTLDPEGRTAKATGGTYTIRSGDTLSAIARRFRVRVSDLQEWNDMGDSTHLVAGRKLRVRQSETAPAASATPRASRRAPGPVSRTSAATGSHVVQAGDTLWRIAQRYGVTLEDLLSANGLSRKSILKPGQRLVIPGAARAAAPAVDERRAAKSAHVVRPGDTLFAIARKYGVTVEHLCRVNSLPPDATLYPGDTVTISR